MEELVATEEAGTKPRRQISPIAPRTDQAVQPALGCIRHGKTRIGILLQHREHATLLLDYSRSCAGAKPPLVMNNVGTAALGCPVEQSSTVFYASTRIF